MRPGTGRSDVAEPATDAPWAARGDRPGTRLRVPGHPAACPPGTVRAAARDLLRLRLPRLLAGGTRFRPRNLAVPGAHDGRDREQGELRLPGLGGSRSRADRPAPLLRRGHGLLRNPDRLDCARAPRAGDPGLALLRRRLRS